MLYQLFKNIAFIAVSIYALTAAFWLENDLAIYATVFTVLAVGIFKTKLVSNWLKRMDFFSPGVIFPFTFFLLAVIGSLADKDVSVLLIAPIAKFRWDIYLFALICYYLGIYLASRRKLKLADSRWDVSASLLNIKIIFVISTVANFTWYFSTGGIPLFASDINAARFASTHGLINLLPYFNRLMYLVGLFSFVLMYKLKKENGSARKDLWVLIFLAAGVVALGGGRQFVEIFFFGLLACHYLYRPVKLKNLALLFVVMIAIFSVYGHYRIKSTVKERAISDQLDRINYPRELPAWTAPPYVYARVVAEVFHMSVEMVPKEMPYQWGAFTFGDFLTFLPGRRQRPDFIFTDKILGGDVSTQGGTALSLLANFYLDFGIYGIGCGFLLVGYVLQSVYVRVLRSRNEGYVAGYCLLLYYCMLGIYGNLLFSPLGIWDFMCISFFSRTVTRTTPADGAR